MERDITDGASEKMVAASSLDGSDMVRQRTSAGGRRDVV
ncbi:hypothetical protein LD597_12175 [Salmonella enterica]|nr:hypothetical protein [Salmonella enterica]MDJ3572412.1 hypothetical protein [Salmonella enterica]